MKCPNLARPPWPPPHPSIAASWLSLPLSTSNVFLSQMFPMSISPTIDFLMSFIGAMGLYMYSFGYVKQFNIHRFSKIRKIVAVFEIILASTLRWAMDRIEPFLTLHLQHYSGELCCDLHVGGRLVRLLHRGEGKWFWRSHWDCLESFISVFSLLTLISCDYYCNGRSHGKRQEFQRPS